MDKHPQITNYLSKIVKEFYQTKGKKQTKSINSLKK